VLDEQMDPGLARGYVRQIVYPGDALRTK
jgi:hypothetical protein